jgi:hypothetical protein
VSHLDRNLWVCNYFCSVPIDHDDGSNGYVDTANVLLWGGTKSLMGYNKWHVGQAMVYVDLVPSLHSPSVGRMGWSAAMEGKPPMCSGMIVRTPAVPGKSEVWMNNTCIATAPSVFFRWGGCNETEPLDGNIPVPVSGNRYFTPNATYALRCGSAVWNLTDSQQRGVDVGSTLHMLPTTDELLAMMRALLAF